MLKITITNGRPEPESCFEVGYMDHLVAEFRVSKKFGAHFAVFATKYGRSFAYAVPVKKDGLYFLEERKGYRFVPAEETADPIKRLLKVYRQVNTRFHTLRLMQPLVKPETPLELTVNNADLRHGSNTSWYSAVTDGELEMVEGSMKTIHPPRGSCHEEIEWTVRCIGSSWAIEVIMMPLENRYIHNLYVREDCDRERAATAIAKYLGQEEADAFQKASQEYEWYKAKKGSYGSSLSKP